MSHAHAHVPHELTEPAEHDAGAGEPSRGERRLELAAVLLLAFTTLATAWSGYQAARWSGEQSQSYARASATRVKAQQQSTLTGQLRIGDAIAFNGWLDADHSGDRALARVYERRFRPEFVPAFEAWRAQTAIPGPQYMPQYRLATERRARAYDQQADALYEDGTQAKSNDDKYILSTVFFAAVLFFAGISLRLDWRPLRIAVLSIAAAMLAGGLVFVASLPVS